MQLRFLVSETPISGSFGTINGLVEGAVDDFVIYEGIDPTSSIDEKGSQVNLAKIYPNPAINELNVIIPSTSFKKVTMALYDVSGKLVSTLPTTGGATHYKIDTKSIIPGQYMLVVEMDKTIQTHKVTIASQ
jgi:extracellular elastinolytic metalloproteinase